MNKYVEKPEDIKTTYEETKIGFLNIAFRKSHEASHYVNLGQAFRTIVEKYNNPEDLIGNRDITISMCEAAGVSTKARGYLEPTDIKFILEEFVEKFLLPVGDLFVEELVSRFMLTQGDALGGRMRNIVGGLAGEKLTQKIVSSLIVRNYNFSYFDKRHKAWYRGSTYSDESAYHIKAICWSNGNDTRLLCYDLTVPIVKKNIDIVIFNNDNVNIKNPKQFKAFISDHNNYLTLGELKGGIDPAGADEHWKTANTALNRIRDAFNNIGHPINTLFIGAAIEAAMAVEIFEQYQSGLLTSCANLTKEKQFTEICDWLVST